MGDVIVIGGGLGGLAAGVRLLQRGRSVTLIEQQPRLGGYAIGYSRGGYRFDLALHVVPAGGEGQEFYEMTQILGLDVRFIRLTKGFDVLLSDFRFQMPNDFDELFRLLAERFPQEAQGLFALKKDISRYVSCYGPLFDITVPGYRSIPRFVTKIIPFLRHSQLTTRDYLTRFVKDATVRAILFQPAAFMGIPMSSFPTVNFIMMFGLLLQKGMYTIEGGGQRLTDELVKAFERHGGRVIAGERAIRIMIEQNRAVAVMLEGDRKVACEAVVAGNNLFDVVEKLVGKAYFSTNYLSNLANLAPSVTVAVLNLGLDCTPEDLGIRAHITMVFPDNDIDACFVSQERSTGVSGFSVTTQSLSEPHLARKKEHTISLVAGTSAAWCDMVEEEYRHEKTRLQEEMLQLAEKSFPGLRSHVLAADLATPRTLKRYTSNPGGAIMGLACPAGAHRRLIQAAKMPVKNVVLASAWTNRLGGFMQSIKSGIIAAEKL